MAFAGCLTSVSAPANPVDLWRLTVHSHQGQPFRATATLDALPKEGITQQCLSMGPESDAPGSDLPFLGEARLTLSAGGNAVEISTDKPITVPSLALVLRVQCPGAPFYARHFSALIPPASRPSHAQGASVRHGFRLRLLPGDTVESIASVVFPDNRRMQQALLQEVIAGNPGAFPGGRSRDVPAGTVLWFPDLNDIRKSVMKPFAAPKPRTSAETRPGPVRPSATATMPPAQPSKPAGQTGIPMLLRKALDLGEQPGPQECSRLVKLCGAEAVGAPAMPTPDPEAKTRGLESDVGALKLKQDGIENQLQRIEQSIHALQRAVMEASAPRATPAPKPEIRTVVKAGAIPWYFWLGLAVVVVAGAAGGFVFGRKGTFTRRLAETDEQLDRMLATAANVMREIETVPRPSPQPKRTAPPLSSPPLPKPAEPIPEPVRKVAPPPLAPAPKSREGLDFAVDTQTAQPGATVDVELESGLQDQQAALSTDLLIEMDQALDNTRSMFTDVDRFIALGRTQNAISLLQFQVHKDPKDRDAWIKLMAIYRQEKMERELAQAVKEFKKNFPEENPPAA